MPFASARNGKVYKIVKSGVFPLFFYALKRVRLAPLEPKDGACGGTGFSQPVAVFRLLVKWGLAHTPLDTDKKGGKYFSHPFYITPPSGGDGPQIYPVDACPAPSGPEKYCLD